MTLLEQLESATVGSRELSDAVLEAMGAKGWLASMKILLRLAGHRVLDPTSSVDDVKRLEPVDAEINVNHDMGGWVVCQPHPKPNEENPDVECSQGHTEPLARCAALVRYAESQG